MSTCKNEKITIGLFGFGVVGQGLFDVLQNVQTADAKIKTICIKDDKKDRPIHEKIFTLDPDLILNDPNINLVVELIDDAGISSGGINSTPEGYRGSCIIRHNCKKTQLPV